MKVMYFIKKRQNPISRIYIRLWESKKYDFTTSTGLQINYNYWDSKNEKVKNKIEALDKDFVNTKLLELKTFIVEKYNIDYNSGEVIGKDWLKTKVAVFFNRVDESNPEKLYFSKWIERFVSNAPNKLYRGKKLSPRTVLAYTTMLNHVLQYESYKKTDLKHSDITLSFYYDFINYCRDVKKLSENTIGNVVKYVKFFCGCIDFEGLPISKDYKHKEFVKPKEQAQDIYLTFVEIEKLFRHDFSETPYLDNARDLLIIGLNTGLRVSDFMRLDLSHIKDDTIRIKAQKTGKFAEIPINNQIAHTLEKRGGNLPKAISEQKFNEYIKEIGEAVGFTQKVRGAKMECINKKEAETAGIEKVFRKVSGTFPKYELMTSHICRRSFATNLYGEIPTPVIMSITGHATETQFLTYIKKTNAENAEVLRNFYKRSAEKKGLETTLKVV
ncbi:tyrosine-type recombinase/integrase [Chryseobacterium sp. HMWF035]|uniref:tyrosine-type recombinase/integrase n=2 Tax=unclassified Chryseobacterium TaxID=2593645 RepID=UPI000D576C96|nr:tyrosine-type recombinase/integrase [Chryseobacterium sp. HMWF035]PVV54811.1 integrase [Chryseobacterium sp. HMWF035]